MRTPNEIIERIHQRRNDDPFSFEWPFYVDVLDFKDAKPFLKPEVTEADWEPETIDTIKQKAINYLPFAFEKANGCRGISATRSIHHYIAWMWLLGHDNTERWSEYEFYGKDELCEIARLLGQDPSQWDDDIRVNSESELH